jgi:transposase
LQNYDEILVVITENDKSVIVSRYHNKFNIIYEFNIEDITTTDKESKILGIDLNRYGLLGILLDK